MSRQSGLGLVRTRSMTVRIQSFLVSIFILYTLVVVSLILPSLRSIGEKPWYLTSRRLVIQEIVFCVPDLTLLLFLTSVFKIDNMKMSLLDLNNLTANDLKERLNE